MRIDRERCALVLVDYQVRLLPAIAEADAVVRQALFLAAVARELGVPVLGTEQNPAGLGANDDRIRAACDETLGKRHFDAARDGLAAMLASRRREQVVVAGCEAHVCLMQTALGLQEAGLQVFVVPEACGSRRPGDKAAAMQRLAERGVPRLTAEMVAFEWLESCDQPAFGRVLRLVKEMPV